MNSNVKSDNDRKKITFIVVAIMVIMITTTSSTYAFLALSGNAVNNITGTVANTDLVFGNDCSGSGAPTIIAPATSSYQSKPMVPQLAYSGSTNVLQLAFNGASGKDKCIDSNENGICRAYSVQVKNCSNVSVHLTGKISFTNPTTNLKWKLMTNSTSVAVTGTNDSNIKSATTNDQVFVADSGLIAPNGTATYYLIFWIQETGSSQDDSGTWYATITFESSNGSGVTSTITGS